MTVPVGGLTDNLGLGSAEGPHALAFELGDHRLAAVTGSGSGVVEIESWTRVPTAPPYVLGIANAQGRILTLVDLRAPLGVAQRPWSLPLRALALGGGQPRVAVAIERALSFGQFEPLEDAAEPDSSLSGFAVGEVDVAGQQATLIDFPAVLASLREESLQQKQPVR